MHSVSGGDRFKSLTVVWLALVAGTALYAGVAYVLLIMGIVDLETPLGPDIMNIGGAFAVVQILAAMVLRRRLVAAIPRDAPDEVRLQRYYTACVVTLALVEGGGMLVVTLALVTGIASWALVGGGAAVLVMLMARPAPAELER